MDTAFVVPFSAAEGVLYSYNLPFLIGRLYREEFLQYEPKNNYIAGGWWKVFSTSLEYSVKSEFHLFDLNGIKLTNKLYLRKAVKRWLSVRILELTSLIDYV